MKIVGEVTPEEMQERFPDLMAALSSDPADVGYCNECDGLRHKDHNPDHEVTPQFPLPEIE